jgi:hypothetical protein
MELEGEMRAQTAVGAACDEDSALRQHTVVDGTSQEKRYVAQATALKSVCWFQTKGAKILTIGQ